MSRASKVLHAASIKHLLRSGVTISTEVQLASFAAFILSDVATRSPLVRKLYIKLNVDSIGEDVSDPDDEGLDDEDEGMDSSLNLQVLEQVLRKTTELEDLSIDSFEELLECEPGVLKAIISLKKLRRLQVSSIGELTASVFEKINSSLVEVDLHCYSEEMAEPDDPVSIVKRHCSTLVRLSASYVELQDADVEFPQLRAVALRQFTSFDTARLHSLFPNLKYLELSPGMCDLNHPDELREVNLEQHVDGAWTALDHLCGSVNALYGLGVSTRSVQRLDVDISSLTPVYLERFHTLVSDTSPSRLLVHIGYGPAATFDRAGISGLLAVPEASSITHFVLDLCLSTLKTASRSIVEALMALLSSSSVSFLVLRLNEYLESDERSSLAPGDDIKLNAEVYNAFQILAHETTVQQLAASCPQLQHVSVDLMGHIPTYWTIARTDGDVSICRLESNVGSELVHREGLWFNDRSMGLSQYV